MSKREFSFEPTTCQVIKDLGEALKNIKVTVDFNFKNDDQNKTFSEEEKNNLMQEKENLESEKTKLESILKEKEEIIDNLTKEKGNLKIEKEELGNKVKEKEEIINNLTEEKRNLDSEKECLENIVKEKEEIINNLTKEKGISEIEKQRLENTVKEKEEIINNLIEKKGISESEKQELANTVKEKEEIINNLIEEGENLESEKEWLKNTVKEKEEIINSLTEEKGKLENRFGKFDDITIKYCEIMDKIYECKSTESIIENNQLDIKERSHDTDNILNFISVFGIEFTFATKIYSAMRDYKKKFKEELNDNEKNLINTVNQYYKERYNIEYDILDCLDDIKGKKFDKKIMQDMDKPSDSNFKTVSELYVPLLRKDGETIQFKAVIKGIK